MTATTFKGHFLGPDTHTNRPATTGLPEGTLYVCTTHQKIERVVSGAWADYATLGTPPGSISLDDLGNVTAPTPADEQALTWDAGASVWVPKSAILKGLVTAKGDLIAASASAAVSPLPVGSNNQVLTADSAQTLGVKWATPAAAAASSLTLLTTVTLASPGTFDVSSISGSYNDLILVLIARGTNASTNETANWNFNADSGSNYYAERLRGASSTASAAALGPNTSIAAGDIPGNTGIANGFAVIEIIVIGYASTTWKKTMHFRSFSPENLGTTMNTWVGGAMWSSTAAITRVQIAGAAAANLATGSQLRIYGRL